MIKQVLIATAVLIALSACSEPDVRLAGLREDVRASRTDVKNQTRPAKLPKVVPNKSWTHRNGAPSHAGPMAALAKDLTLLFSADIGEGDSRGARITASPIVSGGLVYTLDARALVTAVNMQGEIIWTRSVKPIRDGADDASGGGLAAAGGKIFVSSGFGVLTALDAKDGQLLWRQDLDAPGTAAPTVRNGLVYVTAKNSSAWALDAETGRVAWRVDGSPATTSFDGGSGAAVANKMAVFPFPSGEVVALFAKGGLKRWSTVISGMRLGHAASAIDDIAGDPVIFDGRVYVSNLGGQTSALSLTDGNVIWSAPEGAQGPVWPIKNAVFLINDLNELVRLNAANGRPIWRVQLPQELENGTGRNAMSISHHGPILAGQRLLVASSDGQLREFDHKSGELISTLPIVGGAASSPAVARRTLFVVTRDGKLLAFR